MFFPVVICLHDSVKDNLYSIISVDRVNFQLPNVLVRIDL